MAAADVGDARATLQRAVHAFDERLLGRQRELLALGLVLHVAAGSLRRQPLAQVARVGLGALRQRLRGAGPFSQRLVKPELVAADDGGRMHHGTQIVDELAHESIEFRFICFARASVLALNEFVACELGTLSVAIWSPAIAG